MSISVLRSSLVGITVITVILIFAPLASNSALPGTGTGSGTDTNAELCSSAYKVMIFSSLSVCVAKLIEFSVEILSFHKEAASTASVGWSTRWGLISSLLLHNIVNAVVVLPPPGRLDVYWAMLAFRDYFGLVFIVVFLAEHCASAWTTQNTCAFVLLAALSNITRQYSQYTYTFTNGLGIVAALTGGLLALSSGLLLVRCYNTIILSGGLARSSVVSKMALVLNSILVGGCIGGSLESLDLESTTGIKAYQGQSVRSQTTLHVTICGAFIHVCVLLIVIFFNAALSWNEDEVQRRTLSTKRTFVRYVSHEIRTPLNIVSMGLKLLSTGLAAPSVDLSVLGDIAGDMQKSSREAVKILDQLLMYEKIDGNLFILNATRVSVLDFLARNVRSFEVQAVAERKELKIVVDDPRLTQALESLVEEGLASCPPYMIVDDFRLSQVLRNFISNGLKFSPPGSKIVARCSFFARSQLEEEFSAQSPCSFGKATRVRFSVTDQGAGIDAETVNKIGREGFQFQPDKLQSNNGSGLGLFISQGIVSKHNGRFGVTSPGISKGATAFFEVALASPSEGDSGAFLARRDDDKFDNNPSHYQRVIEMRVPEDVDDDDKQFQPSNATPPEVKLRKRSSKISPGSFECDPVRRRSSFERIASIMSGVMDGSSSISSVMPEAESKEATVPHQPSKPPPSFQAVGSTPLRILLVDDSSMNRKFCAHYIRKELAELGTACIVTEADDGVSGVKGMLSSPPPDLVLLDNHMPQRCGPDAARMALDAGFSGRIVGLTGSVLQMEIEDFKTAGVAVVLEKPLDSDRLRALLIGTISALGR